MFKSRIKLFSLLFLIISGMAFSVAASDLERAELNPQFVRQQHQIMLHRQGLTSQPVASRFGFISAPVKIPAGYQATSPDLPKPAALPARFDLRQYNRVTDVKNQAGCGACWSFATMASIESSMMPGQEKNYSPEHLILNHGFDYDPCEGGHPFMSLAYLSRWGGPVNETDFPYSEGNSANQGYAELIDKHIEEAVFLPERTSYTDNGAIKQLIYNKGAVVITYYADNAYLNATQAAYYCNKQVDTNHEVVAVGWDDNYSASNFKIRPPGNGAFIVKNSWGTTWGNDGYFYLSYYDQPLSFFVSLYQAKDINNYGTNYHHDDLGWVTSFGYQNTVAWGANIFQAKNNQPLEAVSIVLPAVNSSCQIRIYRNTTQQNPTSGQLVHEQSVSKTHPGYYTVKLSKPLSLSNGQRFSVVTRVQCGGGYNYPIAVEYPVDGYSSQAMSHSGESFISEDGRTWHDFVSEQANVCIKAFARSYNTQMQASVTKKQINTWILSRSIALISINIPQYQEHDLQKVIVFRKKDPMDPYDVWKEIPVAEMSGGAFTCTDAYLEENRTYGYKIVAIDGNGTVLAHSEDFNLN